MLHNYSVSVATPIAELDKKMKSVLFLQKSESERKLKCYHVANTYFQNKHYDEAIKYCQEFIQFKPNHSLGLALLAKCYIAKEDYYLAASAFKRCVSINNNPDDIVKVCKTLMMFEKKDPNELKIWSERMGNKGKNNVLYFDMQKEILASTPDEERSIEETIALYKAELAKNVSSSDLRVRLVTFYNDNDMFSEAYRHCVQTETAQYHCNSQKWYYCIYQTFMKYSQTPNAQLDMNYYVMFLSVICNLLQLTLDNNDLGHNFDLINQMDIYIVKVRKMSNNKREINEYLGEMQAQLFHIIGVFLLKKDGKNSESSQKLIDLSAMCFATSHSVLVMTTSGAWWNKIANKRFYDLWAKKANHRACQTGYLINDMIEQNEPGWENTLKIKYSNEEGHICLSNELFGIGNHKNNKMKSFIANSTNFNGLTIKPIQQESLLAYSSVSETLYPDSLQLIIWKQLHIYKNTDKVVHKVECNVFETLHSGPTEMSESDSIETICKFDIEAFLALATYSASCQLEKLSTTIPSPKGHPLLPPLALCNQLCTDSQNSFWSTVYSFFMHRASSVKSVSKRLEITNALSVLRMRNTMSNVGLDPRLYVQLARYFLYRWEQLTNDEDDMPYAKARAIYYWKATIDIITSTQKIEEWQKGFAQRNSNPLFTLCLPEDNLNATLRECAQEGQQMLKRVIACEKRTLADAYQTISYNSDPTLDGVESLTEADSLTDLITSRFTPAKKVVLPTATVDVKPVSDPVAKTPTPVSQTPSVTSFNSETQASMNSIYMDQLANLLAKYGRLEEKLSGAMLRITELEKCKSVSASASETTPPFSRASGQFTPNHGVMGTPSNAHLPPAFMHPNLYSSPSGPMYPQPYPNQMPPQMGPQFSAMRGPIQPGMMGSPLPPHLLHAGGMIQTPPPMPHVPQQLPPQLPGVPTAGAHLPPHLHPQSGILPPPAPPKSSFPVFTDDGECVYIEDELEFASTYETMASTFADCIDAYADPSTPHNDQVAPNKHQTSGNRHQKNAPVQRSSNDLNYSPVDIGNVKVQFPTNTPQMMSKESPAQQLLEKLSDTTSTPKTSRIAPVSNRPAPSSHPVPAGQWECNKCLIRNDLQTVQCIACQSSNPNLPPATSSAMPCSSTVSTPAANSVVKPATTSSCSLSTTPTSSSVTAFGASLAANKDFAKQPAFPAKPPANALSSVTPSSFGSTGKPANSTASAFASTPASTTHVFGTNSPVIQSTLLGSSSIQPASIFNKTKTSNAAAATTTFGSLSANTSSPFASIIKPATVPAPTPPSSLAAKPSEVKPTTNPFGGPLTGKTSMASPFATKSATSATSMSFGFTSKTTATATPSFSTTTSTTAQLPSLASTTKSSTPFQFNMDPKTTATEKSSTLSSTQFTFNLKPTLEKVQNTESELYEDDGNDGADIHFEPICKLRDDFVATTGEEGEIIKFENRAKLYRFHDDQWKERGLGDIKAMLNGTTGRARLIMRREQTLKICLNQIITGGLVLEEMKKVSWNGFSWHADDFSEGEVDHHQFALRFKTAATATEFKEVVEKLVENISNERIDKSIPADVAVEDDDDDDNVVFMGYGSTLSDDQIKRARDLQLPDNFFIYENNTESKCPGCLGCIDEIAETNKSNTPKANLFASVFNPSSEPKNCLFSPNTEFKKVNPDIIPSTSNISIDENAPVTLKENSSTIESLLKMPVCSVAPVKPANTITKPAAAVAAKPSKPATTTISSLAAQFKAVEGQWECNGCYVRNAPMSLRCVACDTAKPTFAQEKLKSVNAAKPVVTSNTGSAGSLSSQFKASKGQWECDGCLVRNEATSNLCVACETPKPGYTPPEKPTEVVKPPVFGANGGLKLDLGSSTSSSSSPFSFGTSTFGNPANSTAAKPTGSTAQPIFGAAAASLPSFANQTGAAQPIFGNISTPSFGSNTQVASGNLKPATTFGEKAKDASKSEFDKTQDSIASTLFGKSACEVPGVFRNSPMSTKSIDAKTTDTSTTGVFGNLSQSTPTNNQLATSTNKSSTLPGFSFNMNKNDSSKEKIASNTTNNENSLYEDDGNDGADIHFEPICKMRDDFVAETGEENEKCLFQNRAKLYRFSDNQWKERGLGDIKVLYNNISKKGRLLMRREQILKICLNQTITQDLKIEKVAKPTWFGFSWHADDYSEGEISHDKFMIKFKNSNTSDQFDQAIQDSKRKMASNEISHESKNNESENKENDLSKTANKEDSLNKQSSFPKEDAKAVFSFKLNSNAGFKNNNEEKLKPSSISDNYNFSNEGSSTFATVADDSNEFSFANKKDANFSFAGAGTTLFQTKPAATAKTSNDNDQLANRDVEEEDASLYFEPIVQLAEVKDLMTGEENCKCIFSERSKLYRFTNDAWKERGVGLIKILINSNGRPRIIHRREQILKLAANHWITATMSIEFMKSSNKSLLWSALDFATAPAEDEEVEHPQETVNTSGRHESLSVKFKNDDIAKRFKELFEEQVEIMKKSPENNVIESKEAEKEIEEEDEEEDYDEDYDEVEGELIFEGKCNALYHEDDNGDFLTIGDCMVIIRYLPEDKRIHINLIQDYSGTIFASHTIESNYTIKKMDKHTCVWSAMDESADESLWRTFQLIFEDIDVLESFCEQFEEGIQIATEI